MRLAKIKIRGLRSIVAYERDLTDEWFGEISPAITRRRTDTPIYSSFGNTFLIVKVTTKSCFLASPFSAAGRSISSSTSS